MSVLAEFDVLLAPIRDDAPCGDNLEDSPAFAALETQQVFGRSPQDLETKPPPNWVDVRSQALALLAGTKDLRVLAYLAAGVVKTEGLLAFLDVVAVADRWVTTWWDGVFPLVDGDGVLRRNTLNNLTDVYAILDGVRRAPIVSSREHGRVSLRDLEMAAGLVKPAEKEQPPDEARVAAAFGAADSTALQALAAAAAEATAALRRIDGRMRESVNIEAGPSFEPLIDQIDKIGKALRARLAERGEGVAESAETPGVQAAPAGVGGPVRSRQDAIRALDAVAAFFKQTEPSSPIPFFLERAKRLVSKDFLEVLNDIVPSAASQARDAVGVKDQ